MILKGDSVLWVQNHSTWQMLALDLNGTELQRVSMPVLSYGWIWQGTVDDRGRIWKEEWHTDEEPVFPPPEGLQEAAARRFMIHFDPASEERDSVFVGESTARTFIAALGDRGWAHYAVPFDPEANHVVDPTSGIWTSDPSSYSVARLDEAGDTTLLLTVDVPAQPVTQADRTEYMDRLLGQDPGRVRAAEEVVALMPEVKPVIEQLGVDDSSRLWVRRRGPDGEGVVYDVFGAAGDFRGSVGLPFEPATGFPMKVRGDHLYSVALGSLGVAQVMRVPLPPLNQPVPGLLNAEGGS